ncbi:unnamed protein product [Amoebophrya sp. A120]|nr:unnamed protein product [Amoebophrya sp. A120]|eukprot:GSA120T00021150001.1
MTTPVSTLFYKLQHARLARQRKNWPCGSTTSARTEPAFIATKRPGSCYNAKCWNCKFRRRRDECIKSSWNCKRKQHGRNKNGREFPNWKGRRSWKEKNSRKTKIATI